mgnify:CR=1 FL=1
MMANRVPIDTYCEKKIPTLQNTYDGLIDYIDISSVDNTAKKIISYQTIDATEAPSRAKQLLQQGDVLVSMVRPNLNAVAVVEEASENLMVGSTGYCVLRCKDTMDVRYLFNFCQSQYFVDDMSSQATGASYPAVSNSIVRGSLIPCHSIEEQKAIASVLDKISELISLHKQQLAKLDELVKSRFIELFIGKGYPTKTVDEVSLGKGEYGAQSASVEYDPTRPRYVRITDINDDGTLNDDVAASINPADDEQYKLEYGDFMFARMGATVGKTYAFVEGNQIFAGYLIRYRLNQILINPRYLFWYTRLDEYWSWVKLNQSGAAQPGINAKKYGSLQIPLPPIEEQNEFAAFVEQTDKSKLAIQESLAKLETLKKSLMQQYFG